MKNLRRIKVLIHTQLTFSKEINVNSTNNPKSFYFGTSNHQKTSK